MKPTITITEDEYAELCQKADDIDRLRWLMRQVVNDLPQKRDWLNPDYEREMRAWANVRHEPRGRQGFE